MERYSFAVGLVSAAVAVFAWMAPANAAGIAIGAAGNPGLGATGFGGVGPGVGMGAPGGLATPGGFGPFPANRQFFTPGGIWGGWGGYWPTADFFVPDINAYQVPYTNFYSPPAPAVQYGPMEISYPTAGPEIREYPTAPAVTRGYARVYPRTGAARSCSCNRVRRARTITNRRIIRHDFRHGRRMTRAR